MGKVRFEDFQETLSSRVGRFLLSKGFAIGGGTGEAAELQEFEHDGGLGILYKDPEVKPRKRLFGIITQQPRRLFLGVVWFQPGYHDATERHWVFHVHGRKYVTLLTQLAEGMATAFDVDITVRVVSEQPRVETYQWDNM